MLGSKMDTLGAASDRQSHYADPYDRFTVENPLIFQRDYVNRMGDSKQGMLSRIVNTTPHVFIQSQANTVGTTAIDSVIFGKGGGKASIPNSGLFPFISFFKPNPANVGGNG